MENKNTVDSSPLMIIGGLVAIIVITLGVLGLFAIQQRPVEVAVAEPAANTAADAAASTPVSETAAVTETTTTVAGDAATAVVTDTTSSAVTTTAAAVVTDTASAAVTTTASVTGTAAPVSAAAPAAAAALDMTAVTAAVTKGTCGACHAIPGIATAVGMIGPSLATIGADAGTRVAGTTAEAYLRESILNPNAFIAPKCPTGDCVPGLMLPNLADIITPDEIDLIISYLLTLK
ncbi:MAG: hypothetical protein DYG89_50545 [Caldilinea sp. CFX5]|nr:hypothetical protein [Caldilinea sp. CFX5]